MSIFAVGLLTSLQKTLFLIPSSISFTSLSRMMTIGSVIIRSEIENKDELNVNIVYAAAENMRPEYTARTVTSIIVLGRLKAKREKNSREKVIVAFHSLR